MTFDESEGRKEVILKERSHAWAERYEQALDELIQAEKPDLNALLNVVWNKGILDRLVPLDKEKLEARKMLEKEVWEGGREDLELYWHILYSAGYAREATDRNQSLVGGGFASGAILQAVHKVLSSGKYLEFFPGGYPKNYYAPLIDLVAARAKEELKKRGAEPHKKFIPYGAQGNFKGIEVKVERYSDDGCVVLRNIKGEDWQKFWQITKEGCVSPSELNPEEFVLPDK
ncbi:MAG: hypothetical protein AB1465_02060 [Patescibacteria group bacterium]